MAVVISISSVKRLRQVTSSVADLRQDPCQGFHIDATGTVKFLPRGKNFGTAGDWVTLTFTGPGDYPYECDGIDPTPGGTATGIWALYL